MPKKAMTSSAVCAAGVGNGGAPGGSASRLQRLLSGLPPNTMVVVVGIVSAASDEQVDDGDDEAPADEKVPKAARDGTSASEPPGKSKKQHERSVGWVSLGVVSGAAAPSSV